MSNPAQDGKGTNNPSMDFEFGRYKDERASLVKSELESERGFDTTLVTISTLALGFHLTVLKDRTLDNTGELLIKISLLCLSLCLCLALLDRLLTYISHHQYREEMDKEFNNWEDRGGEGAWDRIDKWYDSVTWFKLIFPIKLAAFAALVGGVLFLVIAIMSSPSVSKTIALEQSDPNTVVNISVRASPGHLQTDRTGPEERGSPDGKRNDGGPTTKPCFSPDNG